MAHQYQERSFDLPALSGISDQQIDAHLKLYSGYVKHTNHILEKIDELSADPEKNKYEVAELRRRFGFEFNGMRNHEHYFGDLSGGAAELDPNAALAKKMNEDFGSPSDWETEFKQIAGSVRGSGWTFLMYDRTVDRLMNVWVTEHHLGQFTELQPIVALDMWEHAYMVDYLPSEKSAYIDSYLANLNWQTIANKFDAALS
jgi:Fe-Mn family superoxide dismutase